MRLGRGLNSHPQGVGDAVAQLRAELGQLIAAPGIVGLALDAVAATVIFAAEVGETDGTETVEAMFTLFQGEGRGDGQADSCQTGDTKCSHWMLQKIVKHGIGP